MGRTHHIKGKYHSISNYDQSGGRQTQEKNTEASDEKSFYLPVWSLMLSLFPCTDIFAEIGCGACMRVFMFGQQMLLLSRMQKFSIFNLKTLLNSMNYFGKQTKAVNQH